VARRSQWAVGASAALLAVLALHANEVVSKDRLIDDLWANRPPERPAHAVDVFVSRLRRALGDYTHPGPKVKS
jgi:DNA-binding winged helix-turn-helix (wHTH) protein